MLMMPHITFPQLVASGSLDHRNVGLKDSSGVEVSMSHRGSITLANAGKVACDSKFAALGSPIPAYWDCCGHSGYQSYCQEVKFAMKCLFGHRKGTNFLSSQAVPKQLGFPLLGLSLAGHEYVDCCPQVLR